MMEGCVDYDRNKTASKHLVGESFAKEEKAEGVLSLQVSEMTHPPQGTPLMSQPTAT